MKKSEIKTIADRIVTKAKAVNVVVKHGESRCNKLMYELNGMLMILQTLDIKYEFGWDYTVQYMTRFKIPTYDIDIIL